MAETIYQPTVTDITDGSRISDAFAMDIDLQIKRDDLLPYPGGGTKVRKMQYIMKDIEENHYDVIVTAGDAQSNHARVAALMAAEKGLTCHLVLVLEAEACHPVSGNLLLMQLAGATIEYCRRTELAVRMDQAMDHYRRLGRRPIYVWGGGHGLAGTLALVAAAHEARSQCGSWIPDFVIHASGTGTTQAGLSIGYHDLPTRIIGISIARDSATGTPTVRRSIEDYYNLKKEPPAPIEVHFRDNWTCGGYEKTTPALLAVLSRAARAGLITDPTYSAKALWGLIELVKRGEIPPKSRVLFWHTGGLMNLMASSLPCGDQSI